jgi:hypothetical protein
MNTKIAIAQKANQPNPLKDNAHGNNNTNSTSKIIYANATK